MNIKLLALCLFCILNVPVVFGADRVGVVISVSAYDHCPALPEAATNGAAMAAFLKSIPGFTAESITTIQDPDLETMRQWFGAQPRPLRSLLRDRVGKRPKEVWIYYSGRAYADGKSTVLLPKDADPANPPRVAYPLDQLVTNVELAGAPIVYLILDAGFDASEIHARKPQIPQSRGQRVQVSSRTMLMQSCQGTEKNAGFQGKMGLFTHELLQEWWVAAPPMLISGELLAKLTQKLAVANQEPIFSINDMPLPMPEYPGKLTPFFAGAGESAPSEAQTGSRSTMSDADAAAVLTKVNSLLETGKEHWDQERYQSCIGAMEQVLKLSRDNKVAQQYVLMSKNKLTVASLVQEAQAAFDTGDYNRTLTLAGRALAIEPKNAEALKMKSYGETGKSLKPRGE